jgi:hypothetical protein
VDADPDSMGSLDPNPDPGGQKLLINIKKVLKIAGCSLLRAEGFSCSLDISIFNKKKMKKSF